LGPALVAHLDGSTRAKERLELILATLAGQVSVVAACRKLGVSEAMFYKLRNRTLQVCLVDLEPKPLGRPPRSVTKDDQRVEELAAEVEDLENELAAQTVWLELARALPKLGWGSGTVKKTKRLSAPQRKRRRK
jgi:transposase-like protein